MIKNMINVHQGSIIHIILILGNPRKLHRQLGLASWAIYSGSKLRPCHWRLYIESPQCHAVAPLWRRPLSPLGALVRPMPPETEGRLGRPRGEFHISQTARKTPPPSHLCQGAKNCDRFLQIVTRKMRL